MQSKLYSLKDNKMGIFAPPALMRNNVEATRSLVTYATSVFQKSGTDLPVRYPNDYTLFEVATFDDETGLLLAPPAPIHVIEMSQVCQIALNELKALEKKPTESIQDNH